MSSIVFEMAEKGFSPPLFIALVLDLFAFAPFPPLPVPLPAGGAVAAVVDAVAVVVDDEAV